MSAKPAEAAAGAAPPKSKKTLIIIVVAVLVLALGGVGAVLFLNKQRAAADPDAEHAAPVAEAAQAGPPVYLPLDSMVVNLADPGGERVAQIGITFELSDAKASDKVKQYLPTIRSSVLLLVSQRTSAELLVREGKEKLATDILRESLRPFGGGHDEEEDADVDKKDAKAMARAAKRKQRLMASMPIQNVLFSSFIVQ